MHYAGRFTDSPNKKYVDGKISFVDMIDNADFKLDLLNTVLSCIGYENDDEHKIMYVYVELVEKTKRSSDEDGEGDSESEDANDIVDEEHLVDEVEVNMSSFKFLLDGEDETEFIDPIQPHVNVTEDDFEVLDFDTLESDQEDVPENARTKERNRAFAVESRRNLDFKRNNKRRIRVICNAVVPTLTSKNEHVDKLQGPKHDISGKGKAVIEDAKEDKISCPWVLYLNLITMNPQIPIEAIQEQMQKKFHVSVSKHKAFRAKAKAQVHLKGDVKVQYSLLRDYVNELQRCNPDTTVKIYVYGKEDSEKTTRMFMRIYICLGALKRGFKEGGRELLGLDGAFMRGQYPGQMLTTVGVDANNGIYPIAYGIVESENQYFWTWFLTCLADDFDLFSNSNFTFITDKKKGLLPKIAKLFPSAEHRDSPIIIALEFVRKYLMKRIVIVQKVIQKCDGPLTPAVTKLFNKIKEAASECTVDWNGLDLFQVKG
ncbi:receptor-like cytoplasmic kinase 176, partial [Tanacetum coccineum]